VTESVRPLAGRNVVVTRPAQPGSPLEAALDVAGAGAVVFPVIRIEPVSGEERALLRRAVDALGAGEYRGLIVTSANAVTHLRPLLSAADVDLAALDTICFAIGDKTAAALRDLGVEPVVAGDSVAEGLLATMREQVAPIAAAAFLFPRARRGRTVLIDGLRNAGARVDAPIAYDTLPVTDGPDLPGDRDLHWVTFTSPSAVEAFLARATIPADARVACIGPTTARAAEAHGLTVAAVPAQQTVEAMVAAMIDAETAS